MCRKLGGTWRRSTWPLLMMAAPQDTDAHMKLLVSVVHVSPRHGAFCQECRAIYDQGFALLRDTLAEVGLGQPSQVHLDWFMTIERYLRRRGFVEEMNT